MANISVETEEWGKKKDDEEMEQIREKRMKNEQEQFIEIENKP